MPPRHPLFSTLPPNTVVLRIVSALGLHIGQIFTRADFDLDSAIEIISELEPYYFHCKSLELFADLNEKRLITILRQCLKLYGFSLKGRETTRNGSKVVQYMISKEENGILEEPVIVSFD